MDYLDGKTVRVTIAFGETRGLHSLAAYLPGAIDQEIKGMGLGRLNEILVRWTFRGMLLKSAYSIADMESMISQTPFGRAKIDVSGIGFRVWLESRALDHGGDA